MILLDILQDNFDDSGRMVEMLDCDSPCDPTAPRTLEGDVKDESPHPTIFMTHRSVKVLRLTSVQFMTSPAFSCSDFEMARAHLHKTL